MSEQNPKPACRAKNRAGEPCRNKYILASGLCAVHDAEHELHAAFHAGPGHTPGRGARRKPGTAEILREFVEANPEIFVGVVAGAIEAQREDGSPDHEMRLKVFNAALDRAYGKPKQAIDQTIEAGESLRELLAPTPLERTDYERLPEGWEGTDG